MLGVNVNNMHVGRKIALLCGMGTIGRVLFAGADALNLAEVKTQNDFFDIDVSKLMESQDYSLLVKAYKKVQRKYYPEKDIIIKNRKEGVHNAIY